MEGIGTLYLINQRGRDDQIYWHCALSRGCKLGVGKMGYSHSCVGLTWMNFSPFINNKNIKINLILLLARPTRFTEKERLLTTRQNYQLVLCAVALHS